MADAVPALRLRALNDRPERPEREWVLYWMVAARRTRWNPGLQHAVALARRLERPLLVLEALRAGHPWASDRLHRFVLDGMADNGQRLGAAGVAYHPYVEPAPGKGAGLLEALAGRACAVVTDTWPCFFVPAMQGAAAERLDVSLVAVDGNGLAPLAAADKAHLTAYSFRRYLQRTLPGHLAWQPAADPLRAARPLPPLRGLPPAIARRWPAADPALLDGTRDLAHLPIDHAVRPVAVRGGEGAARVALRRFLDRRLARYAEERNQPEVEVTSRLSPWLHFGQISVHEVFAELARREDWTPGALAPRADGKRAGWWGMSEPAEAFLDELVTWRELAFNTCWMRPDSYDSWRSLPDWARATLEAHAGDPRDPCYELEAFDAADTHDPLWNAAQRQLVEEGFIHNYLRMLWGKKILEWAASPQEALAIMVELNNRYALDGRDPNSYAGIMWCLGRYDRPWGPERPIFGTVRFMSSANTARKVSTKGYVARYGGGSLFGRG